MPGRQVHDEIVQFAPLHVAQELADGGVEHRAAPDERLTGFHQQSHRDDFHAVGLGGRDLFACWGRQFFDAHHGGDVRTVNVRVHQADACAALRQRDGDVDRDRALAHAALARTDRDGVLDGGVDQPAHAPVIGDIGRHLDLDRLHASHRHHGLFRLRFDFSAQRAGGRRQHDRELDLARPRSPGHGSC